MAGIVCWPKMIFSGFGPAYLEGPFFVNMGPYSSKIALLSYVVPQGAILVPALFALYVHVASGVSITLYFTVLQINSKFICL